MKTIRERRKELEDEIQSIIGRTDFPESKLRGKTKECSIALYCVVWYSNGKRTGNSWQSKKKAIEVRDKKIKEGTFAYTITTYCAGFAL